MTWVFAAKRIQVIILSIAAMLVTADVAANTNTTEMCYMRIDLKHINKKS